MRINCLWCGRTYERAPGGTEDRPQVCSEKCLKAWNRAATMSVTHTTELYFECHITVEPVYDDRLEALKEIAQGRGFRVADLVMRKRLADAPERSRFDTFLTARGTDYADLEQRMMSMIVDCHIHDYLVWRTKIENTLLDVRMPRA